MEEPPRIEYEPRRPRWGDPDDHRLYWVYLVGCVAALGLIFWYRDEFQTWTLFGVSAMAAFFAGILFAQIFRNY